MLLDSHKTPTGSLASSPIRPSRSSHASHKTLCTNKKYARVECVMLTSPAQMKAPKWLVSGTVSVGLKMVRKSIKKKAKFDIRNNKPVSYVHTCKAPALFAHADTDRVIPSKHSAELFEKYPNLHKRFLQFPGDHNTPRPVKFFDAVRTQ